jgi:hypothetical protein
MIISTGETQRINRENLLTVSLKLVRVNVRANRSHAEAMTASLIKTTVFQNSYLSGLNRAMESPNTAQAVASKLTPNAI